MSTPAHLAAEMEALLAYETSSNDEFYECNSDPEVAEGVAAQEDAPEALDDAQPSEEAAEAQEQGPVIPFALPPSDTIFHSLEEAWEFLDRWTGPRGYGLRMHRQGRPNLSGDINSIYLVCDRADPLSVDVDVKGEISQFIKEQLHEGLGAQLTVSRIRSLYDVPITLKAAENERKRHEKIDLNGRTPIQALLLAIAEQW
ncbi:uncharacterized protein Z519_09243 [Cladophialophora bantiana CBS 173.52]|uniref:Uncharacterized protein n=1 Tax=Cladophialophora bantiana (strain ATCC 10958 / CBS 173.52 / CDC B-1940 / NIH 8579) TaxID=1442370 RepID=A0A0D2HYY9_CLAB1|nr:uncharacterized protein Z519_09243 [Cladophialophora bantiana CBS 173.52]KIW89814.1 hypothetical protein Z519_09243 [Cladophialophora bantiana CBS 173.52]